MNDMFMSDFGAAYPIITSVIQRAPTIAMRDKSRAITSSKQVSTPVCQGDAASAVAFAPPRRYSVKGLSLAIMHWKKQPSRLNAALRLL
jgi:hypothetical protein